MSYKFVKVVAVPAVLGIASIRVYSANETNTGGLLSPRELSVYSTLHQGHQYTEKEPGALQNGFGRVRRSLQSCVKNINSAFVSIKVTSVNLYHGGEDIYHFLRDPPSGFVPRVAVITVFGLAGVILARKGGRLRRLALPLSLATAGFSVCYPVQTIAILKVGGKKIYAASRWTNTTMASLWRSDTPAVVPTALESPESEAKASGTQTALIPEAPEAEGAEKPSREVQPPTEPSRSGGETALALAPMPVLDQRADDESLLVTAEEKTTNPLTSTVPEDPGHGADPRLMDFGQSNPEDADLYSTRS